MRHETNPPTPTEVIAAWLPYDARWHHQARTAAIVGEDALRRYVSGLVDRHCDGDTHLVDEYDLRSIAAVREDLGPHLLASVDWHRVRAALVLPLRMSGRL